MIPFLPSTVAALRNARQQHPRCRSFREHVRRILATIARRTHIELLRSGMSGRVLICDDEPGVLQTLSFALRQHGYTVAETSLGADALRQHTTNPFDVLIFDVGLPDINGFELCRRVRQTSQTPIVFLTARSDEIDRIVGFEIGGDDYVTKPFSPREVVARVSAMLRRARAPVAAEVSDSAQRTAGDFVIDTDKHSIRFRGEPLVLARYEYRLLQLLLSRPERVFTRENIMDAVWEQPEMSTDRTVDAHIKMLRAKLRAIDAGSEHIRTHRGSGYSLALKADA